MGLGIRLAFYDKYLQSDFRGLENLHGLVLLWGAQPENENYNLQVDKLVGHKIRKQSISMTF